MAREVTANTGQPEVLLEVRNLVKHFPIRQGIIFSKQVGAVQAVDDVSFTVHTGETLGLVGESGCGWREYPPSPPPPVPCPSRTFWAGAAGR
jgi:ABC-type glutathione transport system ATPase component